VSTPTLLALVRHGESEWLAEGRFQGRGDPPLTQLGLRQATALGARLAAPLADPALPLPDRAPVAIWSSPLRRAMQTAQAIHEAREADAPLRPLDSLTELSQGEWEGLSHDQVRERYPRQLAAWLADPLHHHAPGGESLPEAMERARHARDMIVGPSVASLPSTTGREPAAGPAEPVLGYERLSHGATRPDWAIIAAHDGLLRLLVLDLLGIDLEHFWALPFALASVSIVDLGSGVVRLLTHNRDEHVVGLERH